MKVISVQRACEIFKEHGWSVSPPHIRAGLEAKIYPFGDAIPMGKQYSYDIYENLLYKWIAEREEDGTMQNKD